MGNIAIIGGQFGDEAKGRMTHYFSKKYDWVIRTSGGSNCGHTIYRDGKKYVHNLIPSFDWRVHNLRCYLASGMVVDLEQLLIEITNINKDMQKEYGRSLYNRVYVDPDAFVVLPEHKQEDIATNGHIGSTNRGIGPAYKSKIARQGIRIKNLIDQKHELIIVLQKLGVQFKHVLEMSNQFERQSLLFEGAQGVMIDINHGCYPYVSCGDSTVAGIYASGFAHLAKLEKVYGVGKCYLTKVGEGPFPTELFDDEAEALRKQGNEYGATTGRPRRVGWLDIPALDYACKKGGITSLIITKFDVLNNMDYVKLCVAYQKPPVCPADFFTAQPQFITIPGWKDAKNIDEIMPMINYISSLTGRPVEYVSFGLDDDSIIKL